MATKMLNVRLPEDLSTELDAVATEAGKTVSEFVRNLIDDALYPSKDEGSESDEKATLAEELVGKLAEELNGRIDEVSGNVAKLQEGLDGAQRRIGQSVAEWLALGRQSGNLWTNFEKINELLRQTIEGYNKKMNDVQKLVEGLGEGLGVVKTKLATHGHDNLKAIPELVVKVDKFEQALEKMQSQIDYLGRVARRQPTGDVEKIELNDKTEHYFRKYKSNLGLTRPQHVDELLGDGYWIDLSEPDK